LSEPFEWTHTDAFPPCVERARLAAEVLRETVLRPFPDLPEAKPSPDELKRIVAAAIAWGCTVHAAYYRPRNTQTDPQGVFSLFAPSGGESYGLQFVGGNPFEMTGEAASSLGTYRVHLKRENAWPQLDEATFVLGPIPAQYAEPCIDLLLSFGVDHHFTSITPTNDDRRLKLDPENWKVIRRTLRAIYVTILTKSLGLAAWIRERVEQLTEAVLPLIEIGGDAPKARTHVYVRHAGSMRDVLLGIAMAEFLDGLARKGKATTARSTKKHLIERIPELAPWIQVAPHRGSAQMENASTYRIPKAIQKRISRRYS